MKLLVLRPEPGASATAARIVAAGHQPDLMPLFRLAPIYWSAPKPSLYDALLLTSGNAVRLAGARLGDLAALPAYAVGEATARAALTAGLNVRTTGTAGVAALLPLATQAGDKRLLWLAGRDHIMLEPLPGMAIDIAIVYESEALPSPPDFIERVAEADAVLLHSPRAAAHFGWLCDRSGVARNGVTLAALSPAIAEAAGEGWAALFTAESPNDASLLSKLDP